MQGIVLLLLIFGCPGVGGPDTEELGAVAKLDKYCGSENMFNRQMVARSSI